MSAHWPSRLAITPEALERQVDGLLRKGFTARTFSAAVAAAEPKTVAITFDDAYASVPEIAFPMLSRLGVPGSVFVPTAHAGTGELMSWSGIDEWIGSEWQAELRAATWEQLRELAAAGWEVGSHSHTHPHLTTLTDEQLAAELAESRVECERELHRPCRSIAYPYGDTDDRVAAASRVAGYAYGGALHGEASSVPDRLRWPRLGIYPRDGRFRLGLKLWLFRRPALWNRVQGARAFVRGRASNG